MGLNRGLKRDKSKVVENRFISLISKIINRLLLINVPPIG